MVRCAVSASPECLKSHGQSHRFKTGSPALHTRPSGSASTFPLALPSMNLSAALFAACFAFFALHIPVVRRHRNRSRHARSRLWLSLRTPAPLRALEPEHSFVGCPGVFTTSPPPSSSHASSAWHSSSSSSTASSPASLSATYSASPSISYLSLLVTAPVPIILWLRWKRLPLLRRDGCLGTLRRSTLERPLARRRCPQAPGTAFPHGCHGEFVPWAPPRHTRAPRRDLLRGSRARSLRHAVLALLRRMREPGRVAAIALMVVARSSFCSHAARARLQPCSRYNLY